MVEVSRHIIKRRLLDILHFKYEGGPINTWPTKEDRKFRKSGDLFLKIVSF